MFFDKWAVIFMRDLMTDFGIDVLDAAAIIGNAGHESNGFLDLQEKKPLVKGSKGGYGIMQWTGPRRREYEAYCARNKYNPADMPVNYKFLFIELKGPEGKVLERMKSAKTLNEKTKVFSDVFLRPGIKHLNSRYEWAARALSAYSKAPPPVKTVVADPGELEANPVKSKTVIMSMITAITTPFVAFAGLDWRVQLLLVSIIVGFSVYAVKRRFDLFSNVKKLKDLFDE